MTVQSCSSSHLKLALTKLLKSCQHSFERATHFWCETECQRLDKAVSTFGRSVHIPRQRGLTAEATARDRKTTKTVAVSALFELLLLLRRCAATPHVLQAFYSQSCLGGWRQAPSPLIQLEHKPENSRGRKFRAAERIAGPAGDLNRCTSGLICTSRVDGCLSVTDNLEINLTDYLLITGATIHFNWTYF